VQQIKECNSIYQVRFPVKTRDEYYLFRSWRAAHPGEGDRRGRR
jgi:hypothetical protein